MEKVRWGFVGAGYIAKLALYPALLNSNDGEIYAVGAKDAERGKSLSPSGLVYTDYDELLADPKVEAIYIWPYFYGSQLESLAPSHHSP